MKTEIYLDREDLIKMIKLLDESSSEIITLTYNEEDCNTSASVETNTYGMPGTFSISLTPED